MWVPCVCCGAQVAAHTPLLLVGPTGTGKSVYIKSFLANKLDRTQWTHMVFNFSAQTSANMTQVRARMGACAGVV